MEYKAIAKYIKHSPYKIRPMADVIRGKSILYALSWLKAYRVKKAEPLIKVVESAVANAKNLGGLEMDQLILSEIKVDQGPIFKYFKPGAMGRASAQRRRYSHIDVKVAKKS